MKTVDAIFLEPLFAALEEIPYAVLRNAETLPLTLNGGDIDILVGENGIGSVADVIQNVATACGGKIIAQVDAPHFRQIELIGRKNDAWWGCCIDLFAGVYCRCVLPLAGEWLLEKRIRSAHGVWTLDVDRAQYLGFVKEMMANNAYSDRYATGARRAIRNGHDDFLCSETLRKFIVKVLEDSSCHLRVFRLTWMMGMAVRRPIFFWGNWIANQWAKTRRILRPAGRMVVMLGTDGAGKSTLLNEIMPLIMIATHKSSVVHHLKPDLLPPLGRLRGVKYEPGHVCTNPHGSSCSGFVGSLIRISYLMCDYILGYWLKVRMRLVKSPIPMWIFDRYAYDILLDPRRFRIKLPDWMIRFFLMFVPRPDLLICLGGDPEKIFARKPETSLLEVRRQVDELRRFCIKKHGTWIDTTDSLAQSASAVMTAILGGK